MTTYSESIDRGILADYISRLQCDPILAKMFKNILIRNFNKKSDYKVMKESRKLTGLDILSVDNNQFIIRYIN